MKHSSPPPVAKSTPPFRLVSLLLLAFVAWTIPAQADLTLVEKGRSLYRIVLATNALPAERYAAEELQRYLERISGAKLPIVSDADKPSRHEILLGDNARLRMLKPAEAWLPRGAELLRASPAKPSAGVDFAQLGPDGFVLRTEGERLIIAGGKPRGTLYGVYALLEEKLGVRWFTPELEVVPKRETITLAALNEDARRAHTEERRAPFMPPSAAP